MAEVVGSIPIPELAFVGPFQLGILRDYYIIKYIRALNICCAKYESTQCSASQNVLSFPWIGITSTEFILKQKIP